MHPTTPLIAARPAPYPAAPTRRGGPLPLARCPWLVLAALVGPLIVSGGPLPRADALAAANLRADFNGDGVADLVVGTGTAGEGVHILYGQQDSGLAVAGTQAFTPFTPGVPDDWSWGDECGYALAAGDFNGDGFPDLALGCPDAEEEVGPFIVDNIGAVVILYSAGSRGLTARNSTRFIDPFVMNVFPPACGRALAAGDFNGDGVDDLAIGCPGTPEVGGVGSGAVFIFAGTPRGLTPTGLQYFSQDTPGVPNQSGAADFCGRALAAGDFNTDGVDDLAFGCPGEDVLGQTDGGAVVTLYGAAGSGLTVSGSQLFSGFDLAAATGDMCGWALATGDFNGNGGADLAIGCPTEDVGTGSGSVLDGGEVIILYGVAGSGLTTTGRQFFTQHTPGVPDVAGVGDLCGIALATGDFNTDGVDDLAFGCSRDDVLSQTDGGAVVTLYGAAGSGLTVSGSQLFSGFDLAAATGDECGAALATGDFDGDGVTDLAIGCPGEDLGTLSDAGGVVTLYGAAGSGLTTSGRQFFTQATPGMAGFGAVANAQFGLALASAAGR